MPFDGREYADTQDVPAIAYQACAPVAGPWLALLLRNAYALSRTRGRTILHKVWPRNLAGYPIPPISYTFASDYPGTYIFYPSASPDTTYDYADIDFRTAYFQAHWTHVCVELVFAAVNGLATVDAYELRVQVDDGVDTEENSGQIKINPAWGPAPGGRSAARTTGGALAIGFGTGFQHDLEDSEGLSIMVDVPLSGLTLPGEVKIKVAARPVYLSDTGERVAIARADSLTIWRESRG